MADVDAPEGVFNFRSLGGARCAGGRVVKDGVLYRSAAPHTATRAGLAALRRAGVRRMVDLRTPTERLAAPVRRAAGLPATRVPVTEGALGDLAGTLDGVGARTTRDVQRLVAGLPSLGQVYTAMLSHAAERLARLARLVADGDGGVLVYGAAGKDRTGVAVAVLLDAVGTDRDAIVADYTASADELAGAWADGQARVLAAFGVPPVPAVTARLTAAPEDAIGQALTWLDGQQGGTAGYLWSGGLGRAGLEALHDRLTAAA